MFEFIESWVHRILLALVGYGVFLGILSLFGG
jgi:hypothetical protein